MVKNLPANARDEGLIPGSGRSPGGGHGNPLQYSGLENPMEGGAWWATVHGAKKRWTKMATHSSTLAWRIPWREEPGRLQSMGSQRVGHD